MTQPPIPNRTASVVHVDSIDDPRLADFADIRNRPSGRATDDDFFVVEGAKIVQRLIDSRYHVRTVLIEEGRLSQGRDSEWIDRLDPATNVFVLSAEQISDLAGFHFHRGYLASATRLAARPISEYRRDAVSLALVQISDMENMGSMIRSAAAFGIRQILIDRQSIDPYSRRVLRVSMGAALAMDFVSMPDPAEDLAALTAGGIRSFATSLARDSQPIGEVRLDDAPRLIVMGNERDGLPRKVQQAASDRITIPMARQAASGELIDSLNVSVAAATVMHELTPR